MSAESFLPSDVSGLTGAQAAARLEADGYNELPSARPRTVFAILGEIMREPMFQLLVGCGLVYLVLGEPREALVLLGFVIVVIGITFYQERRTERALAALRDLTSPRALVIRDGQEQRIAGREVVRDDILVVTEGDRVPADAVLLWAISVAADESLLTGESVPVRKVARDGQAAIGRPGGDDLPYVYSGTMVVQGRGLARVIATGVRTELGKIGRALQSIEPTATPLQKDTAQLVRRIAVWGVALCAIVVVVYGITRGDWLQALLAGIALAMAVLPEELPVVLTIFLALGAWRMSQHRVLTRRVPAVESLGAATVLCVDKTGTLTQNRMSARKLTVAGESYDLDAAGPAPLPETYHRLVEFAMLASHRDPFDPTEKAIQALGALHLANTEHEHFDWTLVREYPLSPALLAVSHVWRSPGGEAFVVAAKGAPEAIADLCHIDSVRQRALDEQVRALAADGLRVLGVACARFTPTQLPEIQHDFEFELLGLVGLADPIRTSVPGALQECYAAGIRVIMITGDYPETARSIARAIGLAPAEALITGAELDAMADDELRTRIATVNLFARVVPEQKLRIVHALKALGEVVAMTGDGVNDAPALRAADIGVAMGGRGTDVAREAASLVLLDDDFSSLAHAIRLGRRIFDNLKKAAAYTVAVHIPIAGMSLLPVLFGWPLMLFPAHIAFLELVIDPACSIVFEGEREEPDIMRRPPRASSESLLERRGMWLNVLQGLGVLGLLAALVALGLRHVHEEAELRTMVFASLVFANLALIFTQRSWSRSVIGLLRAPNPAMWWVVIGALAGLALVLSIPGLRGIFRFEPLGLAQLTVCVGLGAASMLLSTGLKRLLPAPPKIAR